MPKNRKCLYKLLGEYFPSPAAAVSYARNMGLDGPIPVRIVCMPSEHAEAYMAEGVTW